MERSRCLCQENSFVTGRPMPSPIENFKLADSSRALRMIDYVPRLQSSKLEARTRPDDAYAAAGIWLEQRLSRSISQRPAGPGGAEVG
jgi:hypothetical protein